MADSDLPGLSSLAGADLADADLLHVVDASDATFAADGTDKKIAVSDLVTGLSARGLATDAEVTSAVSTHSAAVDPHGDRAYAAALVDDLSGVSDAATARTNLGLGSAAIQDSSAFEAAGAVSTHEADTTSVHGIADTSALLDTGDLGVSVQGYDGDLAAIAALSPTNDDIIQRKAGAWTNRTLAQLVTDLNLDATYATDAALSSHESDTTSIHGIADTSALLDTGDLGVTVQGYDGDLAAIAALTPSNDDFIQRKSGAWTNRTVAQVKTDLGVKAPTQQVFDSAGSGTYTTPSGCTAIIVEVVGGGGSGGGVAGSATQAGAGSGGGSGGYARKLYASPAASYTYTVGAGGTGVSAANGNSGGASSFDDAGTPVTANGGVRGTQGSLGTTALANSVTQAGNGAAISTGGDVNMGGASGGTGHRTAAAAAFAGFGGSGPWGGGGRSQFGNGHGLDATGSGSGGGGGVVGSVNTARAGGNGGDGIIIVTEFY